MTDVLGRGAVTNPFPGLRPFREEEEYLFFGRESQIDKIVDKLAVSRFLAVVGTSGSGKSSLVNCGLRPALRRGLMPAAGTAWRFVQFRPGAHPVDAMAQALAGDGLLFSGDAVSGMPLADVVGATLRMSNLGLADVYEQARLPERTNLLVIVDQFEELFRFRSATLDGGARFGGSEEATTFVNLLLAAPAQTEFPIYVVLTMRSDFLGDCAQFYGLPETINEGQYLVPRMTRDQRRAAIAGPVEVMGAQISPVLLTRLVNDTGDNPDQLSILQHALNRTWARWHHEGDGRGPLSVESYEAIGTMARALDAHAEKAFHELQSGRQSLICEKVFKALTDRGTDPRGIRRPTSVGRLRAITGASPRELEEVLNVFRKPSRSFVMPPVPEPLAPETIIDISHESLMRVWKRLHAWTQEEAESARVYRRIQDTASLNAAGKARLWRDPDLQIALDWKGKVHPTDQWADFYGGGLKDVLAFIDRSKAEQDEEKANIEFQRRWVRGCVIPGAIALFGLYAYTTRTMGPEIEVLADSLIPALLPGRLRVILGFLLEITLPAMPFILAGMALAPWALRTYRRIAFPKVLAAISATATQPPPAVPTQTAAIPATEALGTTYAGFGRRLIAGLADTAIFIGLLIVGFFALAIADGIGWPVDDPLGDDATGVASDASMAWWLGATFALHALYHVVTVTSTRRATLGMRTVGIIVTDVHGGSLSALRALARHVAKLLSNYTLTIGYLIQPFTKRRQMLHDLVTKSVVLRAPAEPASATDRPQGYGSSPAPHERASPRVVGAA